MPGVFIEGHKKRARRESGLILETWRVFTQLYSLEKPIFWFVDGGSVKSRTWLVIDLCHVLVLHLQQNCCQFLNYVQNSGVQKPGF